MIRSVFLSVFLAVCHANAGDLVLPPVIYAVEGTPVNLVFRNAALIPPNETVSITCECKIGEMTDDRWTLKAKKSDVGDHVLTLKSGRGEAQTTIRVVPKRADSNEKISLLIVGDSLTGASAYPNEIRRLLLEPGNPETNFLGLKRGSSASHEGYGGWTWKSFNERWEPDEDQTNKKRSSPFLFLKGKNPKLDFEKYFEETCDGEKPDYATFFLGINDCFHAKPDDRSAIKKKINAMIDEAEKLLKAFRKASPETEIGICLTPAANDRDSAFVANYKDKYTRWGWRRIQFELVKRQLKQFGDREDENIFIVPTSVGIDPVAGYPADNALHPSDTGYKQLGGQIYGWLKGRLAERK